ncbi:N-6 DNA methylase [Thiohalobacter thiocyanaticus]|uniref:site-specific DNA-methyltransferase (adenine-specific) n=1 Tax=Thiohalobacter thiocyanaticus TaxID=585455 RepID=A0A426QG69_9GAMM|nr:N-6 DNA methylase [Thiohalobacter thiocyanaticus]RRQ20746.1 restriction endonuclease subunit S [Thiohalobacter thiocyanaticus]
MLDSETKRRIDTCRDILVGKVPDPKSQVEQITIALIYKFMDDMDAEAEELGGSRSFFTGEFARYGWSKLMAPGLGGHEMLSLYAEAIQRMNENPGIPALFRDIFKNAFLPYRDPETLRSFLKEINSFTYDHSERLGDAFEYLLSVLGSQGEAGQFRTPRHIIDFMVEIVDPKKDETILDPACGTAGFLISSYKHILKHNSRGYREHQDREAYDEKGVPIEELPIDNPLRYSGDLLTPDDRKRLAANIGGYDISPDMMRLSLVNMYLHGFIDPHIEEYDTLTSDEKWSELADVILANPPFMSPKGGIRPHNRFAVQSKRSEVLFVDYIAEHLTPTGRAAVVVPEGIIFQSQTAYRQLREMLVKGYLVAVISLPAGVFNPYSGVKTSILVMDKRLAKQRDEVLFVKLDNDGFNLGAQRRPIDKNDLPGAVRIMKAYLQKGEVAERKNVLAVSRERIGENGEWNLSADAYVDIVGPDAQYELRPLGELLQIQSGFAFKSKQFSEDEGVPIIRIRDIKTNSTKTKYVGEYDPAYLVENGDLLIGMDGEFNSVIWGGGQALLNQRVCKLHSFEGCLKEYVAAMIPKKLKEIEDATYAVTVKHISAKQIKQIEIPLPPVEVQKEIMGEIERHRENIEDYKRRIQDEQEEIEKTISNIWGETE